MVRLIRFIRDRLNPALLPIAIVLGTFAFIDTFGSSAPAAAPTSAIDVAIQSSEIFAAVNQPSGSEYIEVTESCDAYYGGACVNMRSGPSTDAPAVLKLRTGTVLKSGGTVEAEGQIWHRVVFDEWLRYPERVSGDHYVAAAYVRSFRDPGALDLDPSTTATSTKRIIVDRSDQMLYAYEGEELFMQESISTGLELTPTPRGEFRIYRKTPTRYMQGPIPEISDKYYDLPGVPWNLYFTYQGAVIHGAYWHDHFGTQWSNGCVNLPPEKAKELYQWAELGTRVLVRD